MLPYALRLWLSILGRVLLFVLLLLHSCAADDFMGIIAWIVLIFVIVEGSRKYRATRQYGLLWLLTVSAERSMPLAPAIEAFARERGGSFSRRAKRLAEMLNAGVPLPDALDQCPGLLPRYATPTIRVGYETGTLARALRRAATVHYLDEPFWMALQAKIAYLLLLPVFGCLLLMFVMLKIVPQFEKIFEGLSLHAAAVDGGSDPDVAWHCRLLVVAVAPLLAWAGADGLPADALLWLDRLGPAGNGAVHAAARLGRNTRHLGAGRRSAAAAA